MDQLLASIGNFGFPMVVAAYLLVRMEGKIDNLSSSIAALAKGLESLRIG